MAPRCKVGRHLELDCIVERAAGEFEEGIISRPRQIDIEPLAQPNLPTRGIFSDYYLPYIS